jgi:hypothetical protein
MLLVRKRRRDRERGWAGGKKEKGSGAGSWPHRTAARLVHEDLSHNTAC